jgi:hypothetical protein
MSCEGCIQSAREKEQALSTVKAQAKQFAIENNTVVFLYYDHLGNLQYMKEEAARLAGIQPSAGIVTHYTPANE